MNDATHRDIRELLGWYVIGRADEPQRLQIEAHLDGCADCRTELASLRPVVTRLDRVDPDRIDDLPTPPAELGENVLRFVRNGARQERSRAVPVRWLVAASVAAIAVGVGVGWIVKPDPAGPPTEVVAISAQTATLEASAELIAHTWGVEVRLTASGFAAGQTFRVQMLTTAGSRTSAGEFVGTGDATMVCNLNSSVLRRDAKGFEVLDDSGTVLLTSSF